VKLGRLPCGGELARPRRGRSGTARRTRERGNGGGSGVSAGDGGVDSHFTPARELATWRRQQHARATRPPDSAWAPRREPAAWRRRLLNGGYLARLTEQFGRRLTPKLVRTRRG
jgi:hypothetical protein